MRPNIAFKSYYALTSWIMFVNYLKSLFYDVIFTIYNVSLNFSAIQILYYIEVNLHWS